MISLVQNLYFQIFIVGFRDKFIYFFFDIFFCKSYMNFESRGGDMCNFDNIKRLDISKFDISSTFLISLTKITFSSSIFNYEI